MQIEILALRHQLAVLQRRTNKRPSLRTVDRLLWVVLSRVWAQWRSALVIVKPETVIAWQRKGFRLYWRWKSRAGKSGRPCVSREVRELIRQMSTANPLWGAPRIHGELLKLESFEQNRQIRYYTTSKCLTCPIKAQCTTNARGRRITRWVDEKFLEDMARRVRARPQLMRRRQQLSEPPFGTMKRAMNQGYFLMRGLDKVGAEMSLTVLSYNLKRAINILGVKKLIEALT